MGVFERIKSAVAGSIPVEDDLDMGNSQRMKNLPQSAAANDAVPETEAQAKANAAQSAAESHADTEIENHRTGETHTNAQPPQSHGNAAHDGTVASENVGVEFPVYATTGDVPTGITEGEVVYVVGDGLYVEDGT